MRALTLMFLLEGLKRGLQYRVSQPYSIVETPDESTTARARNGFENKLHYYV